MNIKEIIEYTYYDETGDKVAILNQEKITKIANVKYARFQEDEDKITRKSLNKLMRKVIKRCEENEISQSTMVDQIQILQELMEE